MGQVDYTDYDTRLAAYVVLTEERDGARHLLLALWNGSDVPRWTLPGGGAELHENVAQTAVREVHEETGYDVEVGEVLWVSTSVVPARRRFAATKRPMKAVRVVLAGEVVGGALRAEVGGSTDEARWVRLDEVASLPHVSLVDEVLAHLAGRGPADRA